MGNLTRATSETRPGPTDWDLIARPEVAITRSLVGFVLNVLFARASGLLSHGRAAPLRKAKLRGIGFVLNNRCIAMPSFLRSQPRARAAQHLPLSSEALRARSLKSAARG